MRFLCISASAGQLFPFYFLIICGNALTSAKGHFVLRWRLIVVRETVVFDRAVRPSTNPASKFRQCQIFRAKFSQSNCCCDPRLQASQSEYSRKWCRTHWLTRPQRWSVYILVLGFIRYSAWRRLQLKCCQIHLAAWHPLSHICFHAAHTSVFSAADDLFACVHLPALPLIRLVQSSSQPSGSAGLLAHPDVLLSSPLRLSVQQDILKDILIS